MLGPRDFDSWYAKEFGDHWEKIKSALLKDKKNFDRPNFFSQGDNPEKLEKSYQMDRASIEAALALNVQDGDQVLDMCAAPGGKSLILAEKIGSQGSLIANDRSSLRRARLRKVLHAYLPSKLLEQVKITSHDATKWGKYQKNQFDKILLDAPCSSERHVLNDPKELKKWSPSRVKRLAAQQYAMLASAFLAAKTGGQIIYSTCALSHKENDEVVARLLKKKKGLVRTLEINCDLGQKTELGWMIRPDQAEWGPIYFAKLEKIKE